MSAMTGPVSVPWDLPPDLAAVVPQLALALWIWDSAGLEPGETAIYTSGSPADRWIGIVAGWRSVSAIIRLDADGGEWAPRPGIVNQAISEPQDTVGWLSARLRNAPGVVAAVLTPEPVAADVILEALPMWGRIVLGVTSSKPATIDFYGNLHRKGTRIVSVPGAPAELSDALWSQSAAPHVARAVRILQNERLANQCLT